MYLMWVGTVLVWAGLRRACEPVKNDKRRDDDHEDRKADNNAECAIEECSGVPSLRTIKACRDTDERCKTEDCDQRVKQIKAGPPGVVHAAKPDGDAGDQGREIEGTRQQCGPVRRLGDAVDKPFKRAKERPAEDAEQEKPPVLGAARPP